MAKRRTLTGAGAASIAVMATLAGAPAASAQECVGCEPQQPGATAFLKLAEQGFPGQTAGVFFKDNWAPPGRFEKICPECD